MEMKTKIIRSDRKTAAIQIKPDLTVIIRVPQKMRDSEIEKFIISNSAWIEKHLEIMKLRQADENKKDSPTKLTDNELKKLATDAAEYIAPKAEVYAKLIGVEYKKITIRNQKTVWGSCSAKKNLNFNCLLMLCPEEVRDYVIIHELCHLAQMNHSAKFWKLVSEFCPEYKAHRAWLKDNGNEIIRRTK